MIYYSIAFFGIMNVGHASAYNHFFVAGGKNDSIRIIDGILRGP